ncbi:site-specific DNA-cytosine methylase [Arthrobacter sp. W4I7]|nr:site-specific DNA-cytosine methylase [Arthrobacter sp. W4I7]
MGGTEKRHDERNDSEENSRGRHHRGNGRNDGDNRTWTRESDGARLASFQAGALNGFPAGFPWTGSRSRQFLQAANVVAPQLAAALLGEVAA